MLDVPNVGLVRTLGSTCTQVEAEARLLAEARPAGRLLLRPVHTERAQRPTHAGYNTCNSVGTT